jgi:CheY-like chemotaxis protein/anti-sigma regulatory factor (Ser/Thr protein kinase)
LKADAKGIELAVRFAPDVPPALVGDPSRLRQIVLNLIGNAIKFTERGDIVVRVERDPEARESDCRLRFSVTDSGIGIPADRRDMIFDSFTQVDSSTTRKYGGTGLGLTICRSLVGLMGGRIWVESEEGRGSTFRFTADFGIGETPLPAPPPSSAQLSGRRMLVVDDNDTNRLILREMLGAEGVSVTESADGPTGLRALDAAQAEGRPYDLVLLDCRMPDMDGFDVAARIRAAHGKANAIMMLTSSNLSADLARSRAMDLEGYLVKPIKRAELLSAIGGALQAMVPGRSVTDRASGAVAADIATGAAARILLVEDNADNRLLIRAYLKNSPYLVDEAENGEFAIEAFKRGQYDLVLMDVQMPVMDGHAATRLIREWEGTQPERSRATIIALTAHAIKEDMEKSLAAGCDAHLTKPIKKQTLLTALTNHLAARVAAP